MKSSSLFSNASCLYREIAAWADDAPERVAYESGELRLSYAELVNAAERFATELEAAGAQSQELLAFEANTSAEFLTILLAGLALRMLVAPIAAELPATERCLVLTSLQPRFFLSKEERSKITEGVSGGSRESLLLVDQATASLRPLDYCEIKGAGAQQWSLERFATSLDRRIAERCANGGCVRFTSGTTGSAKGVVISTESARERILAAQGLFRLVEAERVLSLMAMPYHFVVSVLQFLRAGTTIVRPPSSAPSALVSCFEESDCEVVYAAPFHLDVLVGSAQRCPERLRLLISTSTNLRADTARRWHQKFGQIVVDSYGLIEVGVPLARGVEQAKNPHGEAASGDELFNGIGYALTPYEAAIEDNGCVKASGSGTLLVRGPGMFDAYLSPIRFREEVLQDSWFETGDLAEIAPDGFITIKGRRNSAIHVAGFKVFPEEIEAILLTHESILDAQVVGIAHPSFGSTIHARIVLHSEAEFNEDELRQHCRLRLGTVKTPHSFESVALVARTMTGKVRRDSASAASNGKGEILPLY